MLRRVENPRTKYFDCFSYDTNLDKMNTTEEDKVQSNEREDDGEVREAKIMDTNTKEATVKRPIKG